MMFGVKAQCPQLMGPTTYPVWPPDPAGRFDSQLRARQTIDPLVLHGHPRRRRSAPPAGDHRGLLEAVAGAMLWVGARW